MTIILNYTIVSARGKGRNSLLRVRRRHASQNAARHLRRRPGQGAVEINGVRIDARDGAAIKDSPSRGLRPSRGVSNGGQNKRKRGKDTRRPACSFLFSRTEPA
jgi:hypothetical protein